jgi:mRNA degradation ribonuclease J1/J2
MRVEVLGSYGGESQHLRMTCLLINDTIALDAGSLSQVLPIERQRDVEAILLTHSHMDHTNSLPFFVENVYGRNRTAIDIYASTATIYALRKNLFNNASWPDFTRLPNNLLPTVRFQELEEEEPIVLNGVKFTPFSVDHLVPTFGFLIEQDGAAIV